MVIKEKELLKEVIDAKNIYIMGHSNLDLDAIGSAIGLAKMLETFDKKATIIINDETNELAVEQVLRLMKDEVIMKSGQEINPNKDDLLIIVDTNKEFMTQDPSLIKKINKIIIIDHHDQNEDTIKTKYRYIDSTASSACEILTELLSKMKIKLDSFTNTLLLAGIVLDTNNFVVKTDEKTYYSAYQLCKNGAEPVKVQYLLKQDISDYIARQKVITNVKVYDHIAITSGEPRLKYRREELAKVADTLLQFKSIEASFVIGATGPNTVGISARSMGNIPVSKVMEHFGGGGDSHDAATKIEGKTVEQVEQELLDIIKQK